MRSRIILLILFCLCATQCESRKNIIFSNSYTKIYKNSVCKPDEKFPQIVMIPFFESATQLVEDCKTYPKHKTALAMMIFYHKWQEYFGDSDYSVKNTLNKTMIKWGKNVRALDANGFDLEGEPLTHALIAGLTESKTVVWVWQGKHGKISETSLMHELVHISLGASVGNFDPDHEGGKYYGWSPAHSVMIEEAKDMLRAFNI